MNQALFHPIFITTAFESLGGDKNFTSRKERQATSPDPMQGRGCVPMTLSEPCPKPWREYTMGGDASWALHTWQDGDAEGPGFLCLPWCGCWQWAHLPVVLGEGDHTDIRPPSYAAAQKHPVCSQPWEKNSCSKPLKIMAHPKLRPCSAVSIFTIWEHAHAFSAWTSSLGPVVLWLLSCVQQELPKGILTLASTSSWCPCTLSGS